MATDKKPSAFSNFSDLARRAKSGTVPTLGRPNAAGLSRSPAAPMAIGAVSDPAKPTSQKPNGNIARSPFGSSSQTLSPRASPFSPKKTSQATLESNAELKSIPSEQVSIGSEPSIQADQNSLDEKVVAVVAPDDVAQAYRAKAISLGGATPELTPDEVTEAMDAIESDLDEFDYADINDEGAQVQSEVKKTDDSQKAIKESPSLSELSAADLDRLMDISMGLVPEDDMSAVNALPQAAPLPMQVLNDVALDESVAQPFKSPFQTKSPKSPFAKAITPVKVAQPEAAVDGMGKHSVVNPNPSQVNVQEVPFAANKSPPVKEGGIESSEGVEKTSPFKAKVPGAGLAHAAATTRNNINAVKVVTHLVGAMQVWPGPDAPGVTKARLLSQHLVLATRVGQDLAKAAQVEDKPWAVAQCVETAAELIGTHIVDRFDCAKDMDREKVLHGFVTDQVAAVRDVLANNDFDLDIDNALQAMSFKRYMVANDPNTVRDRVGVSLTSALWEMHEKVSASDYQFGLNSSELVSLLAKDLVPIVSKASAHIEGADMQTAHMQGSLRRLSSLICAGYIAHAKRVANSLKGLDGMDRSAKEEMLEKIHSQFQGDGVSGIVQHAVSQFDAIEKMASKLLSDSWGAHQHSDGQEAVNSQVDH